MENSDENKICPILSAAMDYRSNEEAYCRKERCAWWVEDRQKCSMAVTPPRK